MHWFVQGFKIGLDYNLKNLSEILENIFNRPGVAGAGLRKYIQDIVNPKP